MIKINMDHVQAEKDYRKPRILVAPLDWGLGHATRCIPVIYELIRQDAEIWLAGAGAQRKLLAQEFPQLPFLPLKGYGVKLSRSASGLGLRLLLQIPRILKRVKEENHWLAQQVADHGLDAIISDNRFGLYHPSIPSVFITHQLGIRSPFGKWTEGPLQRFNYRFLDRFTECWVPDAASANNLAGELSHPAKKPAIPIHYIGALSRLKKSATTTFKDRLFISLSGPEPQRSLLEDRMIQDISHYTGTAVILRGLPEEINIIPSTNDIRFYNHLATDEFNKEMEQAEVIISRSGYSTVMDIAALQKRSILIPTPGQTEQEYLAKYLAGRGLAITRSQAEFSLPEALLEAKQLEPGFPLPSSSLLVSTIAAFLRLVKQKMDL